VTATRVADLVGLWLLAAALSWLLVRIGYGALPPVPVLAGASLLVLAAVEVGLALVLRNRIERRRGARLLDPIMAARSVALAKASSLVGALVAGVWTGVLGLLGARATLAAAAADTPGALVGLVCAVLLVGAALHLERTCRTPGERGPGRD